MLEPKISVIVPIYNVEKYLVHCIESIINQTYKNLEIILVDDGSLDNCPTICDEFAKKDSRIIVIHKKNGGLSDARNAGLDIATGEYIGFVDSDDYISTDMYRILFNRLSEKDADMAICNYLCVDEDYELLRGKNDVLPIDDEYIDADKFVEGYTGKYGWYYVVAWNKLYKRKLFENLRYPIGKKHEDAFLIHRIVYKSRTIACIKAGLYYYVQRPGSIMAEKFSVKSMDIGEALIDQYYFAKKNRKPVLKNYAVRRFSYKLESWKGHKDSNLECKAKYNVLRKRAKFLTYEKSAWDSYPLCTRIYYRLELLMPRLAKKIRGFFCCIIKKLKSIKSYIFWTKKLWFTGGKTAYIFGTPMHKNIGDSAILIAEREFLKKCGYINVVEVSGDEYLGFRKCIRRLLPKNAALFLPGGGNMGDLWLPEENLRREIIADFQEHQIVIFPQTIHYSDTSDGIREQEKSIPYYNCNEKIVIVAREKTSYETMKNLYSKAKILVTPDIVLSMKFTQEKEKREGILLCFRNDKEKDLTEENIEKMIQKLSVNKYLITRTDTMSEEGITTDNRERIVRQKLKQFSEAKVVITDRLHGMVFAAITGTPCLVFANNHHKVQGTYEWIRHLDYIEFLENMDGIEQKVSRFYQIDSCEYYIDSNVYLELEEVINELSNK